MNSDFSDWDSESEASEFRISTKINFKLNVFVQCQQISQKISLEKTSKIFARKSQQRISQMKILDQINLEEQHIPKKNLKRKYAPRNH